MSALRRIADALERIAAALEERTNDSTAATVRLDGRKIGNEATKHVLRQAARGPGLLSSNATPVMTIESELSADEVNDLRKKWQDCYGG